MTALYRPYTTLDQVKNKCGIALTDTSHDDKIKAAINKMSRYIDTATGRFYYKQSYSDYYLNTSRGFNGWQILNNDNGGLLLTKSQVPIISVSELVIDDTTLTENEDFYIDYNAGIIERSSGAQWPAGQRSIKITCDIGYDSADTETPSDDIPGDVAYIACELAARESGEYKKTVKSFVTGQAEVVDLIGIPKEIEKQLNLMRPIFVL